MSEISRGEYEVDAILAAARNLFHTARKPYADAAWPRLKTGLLVIEARLQRTLRENPDDDATAVILQEVRRYLGRST